MGYYKSNNYFNSYNCYDDDDGYDDEIDYQYYDQGLSYKYHYRINQVTCYYCNEQGHYSNECNQIKCYNCNQQGHVRPDCPSLKQSKKSKTSFKKETKLSTSSQIPIVQQSQNDINTSTSFSNTAFNNNLQLQIYKPQSEIYFQILQPLEKSNTAQPANIKQEKNKKQIDKKGSIKQSKTQKKVMNKQKPIKKSLKNSKKSQKKLKNEKININVDKN
ncbi:hypothetical protein ABPG74_013676 [Tetrahymena malaccensis]